MIAAFALTATLTTLVQFVRLLGRRLRADYLTFARELDPVAARTQPALFARSAESGASLTA